MNEATLVGNLAADPVYRVAGKSGRGVIRFNIAVNRRRSSLRAPWIMLKWRRRITCHWGAGESDPQDAGDARASALWVRLRPQPFHVKVRPAAAELTNIRHFTFGTRGILSNVCVARFSS
jgi:hypothetical protein